MSAQQEFDQTYITSSEIMGTLGIGRVAMLDARRRGVLPDPIRVNKGQIMLWKRDEVKGTIESWWTVRLGKPSP